MNGERQTSVRGAGGLRLRELVLDPRGLLARASGGLGARRTACGSAASRSRRLDAARPVRAVVVAEARAVRLDRRAAQVLADVARPGWSTNRDRRGRATRSASRNDATCASMTGGVRSWAGRVRDRRPRVGQVAGDEEEARAQPVDVRDRELSQSDLLAPRRVVVVHAELRVGELHVLVRPRPPALRLGGEAAKLAARRQVELAVVLRERLREVGGERRRRRLRRAEHAERLGRTDARCSPWRRR